MKESSSSVRKESDSVQLRRSMAVGLGILAEINCSAFNNRSPTSSNAYNVVMNSVLKSTPKPLISFSSDSTTMNSKSTDYCFLKSCGLCNKKLSLDKEVYMYMGDQGFCSIECRNRQIYVDEMKEIEISTKKTLASIRRCRDSNWRDTSSTLPLQEEYRQHRRRPQTMSPSCQKSQAIFIQ